MARKKMFNLFEFRDSGEDDGTREYDDEMHVVCNRCGTRMSPEYDPDKGVDYYLCPSCGFVEIDTYDDDFEPPDTVHNDYEDYWGDDEDEEFDPYAED